MIWALLLAAIIALGLGPQLWIRSVMRSGTKELDTIPGTGGELAKHLVERFELEGVTVEQTDPWRDHFDPSSATIRLGPDNFNGHSLTAVAVAAHEVGHAIQFHRREAIFQLRQRYLPLGAGLQRVGVTIMAGAPLMMVFIPVPAAVVAVAGFGIFLQLLAALIHLIVLPEEWDASFNKALPVLADGYLAEEQLPEARRILRAAALTYFAGALASILNISRLFLLLRR